MGITEPTFNQNPLQSSGTKYQVPVCNGSSLHWGGACSSVTGRFHCTKVSNRKVQGYPGTPSPAPLPPEKKSMLNQSLTTLLYCFLTRCGRVTQICVFNTVKLGTSASSPYCHSTRGNVSRGITPSSTTRVFGEYFLKISVHKNS